MRDVLFRSAWKGCLERSEDEVSGRFGSLLRIIAKILGDDVSDLGNGGIVGNGGQARQAVDEMLINFGNGGVIFSQKLTNPLSGTGIVSDLINRTHNVGSTYGTLAASPAHFVKSVSINGGRRDSSQPNTHDRNSNNGPAHVIPQALPALLQSLGLAANRVKRVQHQAVL